MNKSVSWVIIFGVSLLQVAYAALPEIPVGDYQFFGYSPYLLSFYFSLAVLAVFTLSASAVLFRVDISDKSIPLKILRFLYTASVMAVAIKALALLMGWSWSMTRDFLFPNLSNTGKLFWEIGLPSIFFIGFCIIGKVSPKVLRFIAAIGFTVTALLCIRIYQDLGVVYTPRWVSVEKQLSQTTQSRKVVWVIFDEFDPEIAFDQKNIDKLPNFKQLLKRSVYHTNLYGPSSQTRLSVPSMLMGLAGKGVKVDGTAKIFLEDQAGKFASFDFENTIFSQLSLAGFNSSILGFYIPYCEIFKQVKCISFPWDYQFNPLSAIEFVYGMRPAINALQDNITYAGDPMGAITKDQYENLDHVINDPESDFIFMHLNIPHLPGNYSRKMLDEKGLDPYIANLHLADLFLEKILRDVNQQVGKKTLLILNSDHWNRKRSGGPYPALFIASISGQDGAIELIRPTSGIYIKDLVREYLNGKISTNQEIADYFKDKSYHDVYELKHDRNSKKIF